MSYTMTNRELKWELLMDGYLDDKISDFMSDDADKLTLGDSYYKKKKRILAHEAFKIAFRKIRYISSKIAMIFVAIILVAVVTVMSVSALRNAVWNAILEWYEEYIDIKYTGTEDPIVDKIEEIHKPTNLPEGVEEFIWIQEDALFMCEFVFEEKSIGIFEQHLLKNTNSFKIDSIEANIYSITINDSVYTVVDTKNNYNVFWNDGVYYYTLYGENLNLLMMLLENFE